jgi:hypothetical protein
MKLFFAFALVVLAAMSQAQTSTQNRSDLIVLKFSCNKYENGGRMIRSVQEPDPPMNEPISINPAPRSDEPQELKNRRDLQQRRADMRTAEINATLSGQPASKIYVYRLQVKNASAKVVKGFAWEYQPSTEPDPLDRQFFCVVKTKPNESKEIELFSPLAPSRVIDAAKAGDKSAKSSDAGVIINKIEYMDGSIWQRTGWNPNTFRADDVQKIIPGKCIGL